MIDALDECRESDRSRDNFLVELMAFPSKVQLMITSRPNKSVEHMLKAAKTLEKSAHEHDLQQYLAAKMAMDSSLVEYTAADRSLQDTIISKIIKKARGMYVRSP